jgi:hypothetical protein
MTRQVRRLRARVPWTRKGAVRFGPGQGAGPAARRLTLIAALSLGFSLGIELVLFPAGVYLSLAQLWLLTAGGLLVLQSWRTVGRPPPAGPAHTETAPAERGVSRFQFAARWERRLSVPSGNPEWFGRVARDRLAALVRERIRQRHGIQSLPQARTILGEELYAFLTAPLTRTPSPAELDRLITRMEEL